MQMALRQFGLCDVMTRMTDHSWLDFSNNVRRAEKGGSTIGTACLRPPLVLSRSAVLMELQDLKEPKEEETFPEPKPQATQAVAALDTTPFFCGNARILHVLKCNELRVQVVPLRVHQLSKIGAGIRSILMFKLAFLANNFFEPLVFFSIIFTFCFAFRMKAAGTLILHPFDS